MLCPHPDQLDLCVSLSQMADNIRCLIVSRQWTTDHPVGSTSECCMRASRQHCQRSVEAELDISNQSGNGTNVGCRVVERIHCSQEIATDVLLNTARGSLPQHQQRNGLIWLQFGRR